IQGILTTQIPPNEQGRLQGAIASLMSLTAIIGPVVMTNLFAYFAGPSAPIHFPGAAFAAGALLMMVSIFLAMRSLALYASEPDHPLTTVVASGEPASE